jgi:hypothetical protein
MMAFSEQTPAGPKDPRTLAGRLRRAQTFLRVVGIDIAFSREGRAGNRVIRMRATHENSIGTVSGVGEVGSRSAAEQPPPQGSSPPVSTMDPVYAGLSDMRLVVPWMRGWQLRR